MRTSLIFASVVASLLVAGCGSSSSAAPDRLAVVAAENVYGDVAAQIGGRWVSVSSVLSDPNADPHLYEPGTRNGLSVAKARVVIQNGAGYDDFMSKLEQASPSSKREVVTIADVLGVHGHDANPHLWYDVPALNRISAAIAGALSHGDPSHASAYRFRLRRFQSSLRPLRREVAAIRQAHAGAPVAYTEPVPGYLVAAAGLRNLAPDAFTHAIETGVEPTPQAVSAMNALVREKRVRVLLYNRQAVSPITAAVRDAAVHAGIPVVGVTETLPGGMSFQRWQLAQAQALRRALSR